MSSRVLTPDVVGIDATVHDHQTVLAKLKAVWLPYLLTMPRRFMPSRLHARLNCWRWKKTGASGKRCRSGRSTLSGTASRSRCCTNGEICHVSGLATRCRLYPPGGAMGRGTKRAGGRRRTGVIHCLLAGGRQSLSPCAVATKLARSLQIGRASNGGLPKRDVNTVSEPDSQIPP